MKKVSLLTIAIIITLMAGTASASNGRAFLCIGNDYYARVGEVIVANDGINLTIIYFLYPAAIADGWVMTETHLHVTTDPSLFPMTGSGNPKIGHFDYTDEDAVQPTTPTLVQYIVPMPGVSPLYIAAHAVVQQLDEFGNVLRDETGWGWCTQFGGYFPGKSWATYMTYLP